MVVIEEQGTSKMEVITDNNKLSSKTIKPSNCFYDETVKGVCEFNRIFTKNIYSLKENFGKVKELFQQHHLVLCLTIFF